MLSNSLLTALPEIKDHEVIIWQGKPHKGYFIASSIFNIYTLFISFFVLSIIIVFYSFLNDIYIDLFELIFTIPFSIILGALSINHIPNTLFCLKRYKNFNYILTDRAIYITDGILKQKIYRRKLTNISNIDIVKSSIETDQAFDLFATIFSLKKIVIKFKYYNKKLGPLKYKLIISSPNGTQELYEKIQTHFTNALREQEQVLDALIEKDIANE